MCESLCSLRLPGFKQYARRETQVVAHTTYFTKGECPSLHIQLSLSFPFCSLQGKPGFFAGFWGCFCLFCFVWLGFLTFILPLWHPDTMDSLMDLSCWPLLLWVAFFSVSISDCILVLPLLHSPLYLIWWAENFRVHAYLEKGLINIRCGKCSEISDM